MRERARATLAAFARAHASGSRCSTRARRSRAPPRCGSSPRRACRSTWRPAASCTWRWRRASIPRGSTCTATTRPTPSSRRRVAAGIGHVIVDSLDEIDRLERIAAGREQKVLVRVTPGIEPETHRAIRTGQEDSKFGMPMREVEQALSRAARTPGLELRGLHAHIGSQVFDLDVYESLADVLQEIGDYPLINLGGGFAIAYTREDRPPPAAGVRRGDAAPRARRTPRCSCEPGRSLVGERGRDALHRGHGEGDPGRAHLRGGRRRHGRQHQADALRRRLRGGHRRPHRRLHRLPHRGHALRVRRRAGARRRRWRTRGRATWWRFPPPAHTVTRWPATTTPCRGPRWCSAATATPAWSCAARPTTTSPAVTKAERALPGRRCSATARSGAAFEELLTERADAIEGEVGRAARDRRACSPAAAATSTTSSAAAT